MGPKDVWDLVLNGATVLFAGAAAWKAFAEFRLSRIQRKEDLRWKQAESAKTIIDEWMDDKRAYDFCKMIEYDNRSFKNEEGHEFFTDTEFIKEALNDKDEKTARSKREVDKRCIRDSCDSFLYYTEMMNQGREGNLYLLENLLFPLRYYLERMQEKKIYQTVRGYACDNKYKGSVKLFGEILNDLWQCK
jgi:hypothetical protein